MIGQLSINFTAAPPALPRAESAGSQLAAVRRVLSDGRWHTLAEIASAIGILSGNTTGVSARIRDLRKPEHGGHVIERRAKEGVGAAKVYEYRMGM